MTGSPDSNSLRREAGTSTAWAIAWVHGSNRTSEQETDEEDLELSQAMGSTGLEPVTEALVERMVRAIVEAVDPEQIILFGSRARGTQRADSDIDLLVVQSEPFGASKSRHQETVRAYEAVSGLGVAKDILVYSRSEVEYWRDSLNHVVARALREGEILYERPKMCTGAR